MNVILNIYFRKTLSYYEKMLKMFKYPKIFIKLEIK